MSKQSHIVNVRASANFHRLCVAALRQTSHNVNMDEVAPNNLRAWRQFRGLSQAALAERVDSTAHMISYLETGQRGLSLKWLLRLAPVLETTPGFLLDHNPDDLPADVLEIWGNANERQRRQIVDIAKTIVRNGTEG